MRWMTGAGESDEALMMRYGRGDAAAFEPLYRRHEMRIWRYLERNVGQPCDCGRTDARGLVRRRPGRPAL